MALSFECGSCHAVYRLDEEQITSAGVKVTCPKCLNYFLLRQGAEASEKPIVEQIVADGPHVVDVEPPKEGEMTADQLLDDEDIYVPLPPEKLPEDDDQTVIMAPSEVTSVDVVVRMRKKLD